MFSMFKDHFEGGHHHMRHGHRHGRQMWRQMAREGAAWFEGETRMRRGDVKFLLLGALTKRPMHGYDIMQDLEETYQGRYRPSPGSVYPTLQMLEDGGFVSSQVIDGKRIYEITDAGRKLLEERGNVEDETNPGAEWSELREAVMKFASAVQQGFRQFEDAKTRERIKKVLDDARKEIYTILQDD
jgi:DNA-binding PadR family transcriptional regulator